MSEPLIVGSQDVITGTIYDNQDGTLSARDLTGATVAIKASIAGGATLSWTVTVDPDQATNPGKYSYTLGSTDIAVPGIAELQAWVTAGGATNKSKIEKREIVKSL